MDGRPLAVAERLRGVLSGGPRGGQPGRLVDVSSGPAEVSQVSPWCKGSVELFPQGGHSTDSKIKNMLRSFLNGLAYYSAGVLPHTNTHVAANML